MKRLASILILCAASLSALAQTPPTLRQSVAVNGDRLLTWTAQIIPIGPLTLGATYQLESTTDLSNWAPQGSVFHATNFPTHIISTRINDALTSPATFLRVRAVLDFTGGDFSEKSLQNGPLANAVFTGANFFNAKLDNANFDNADLLAADFRFATMTTISATNADFTLARLADADLTSADLRGATLINAELSGAKLTFADLTGADLRGAIIQDTQSEFTGFHKTIIDDTTVFDRRPLAIWLIVNGKAAGRTFTDVDLSLADLSGGDLSHANLAGLDLSANDFSNADLTGANLTNTVLRLLDLRGTKMDDTTNITNKWRVIWDIINNPKPDRVHPNTDFSLSFFIGATLERADIHNSNFNSALIDDMNFEGCNAATARFTNVEFHNVDFKNADLHSATFFNAILDNVNFLGANLTTASFTGATFNHVTMPDGTIRNP